MRIGHGYDVHRFQAGRKLVLGGVEIPYEFGLEAQQKLKAAKVLIVGSGGLGSPALLYLAAAGVGTIGIVDFDVVDDSNLQRQILFGVESIGSSSVIKILKIQNSTSHRFRKFGCGIFSSSCCFLKYPYVRRILVPERLKLLDRGRLMLFANVNVSLSHRNP